ADGEDANRPPGMGAADVQERGDCAERSRHDADDAAVEPPTEQRHPARQLKRTEDDRYPAPGVEAGEHELRVIDEEVRIIDGPDAVDDVERARHKQQDTSEDRTTSA